MEEIILYFRFGGSGGGSETVLIDKTGGKTIRTGSVKESCGGE